MPESSDAARPLAGRKILVTRPRDQASKLSERIRALGGDPVEVPAIAIAPLDDTAELDRVLTDLRAFEWVVFTSANGVAAVIERLAARGEMPGALNACRVAAIGPATARALDAHGVRVDFVPSRFVSDALGAELPVERGTRVLLLRADIAPDRLANLFTARKESVTSVAVYRTVIPDSGELRLEGLDAVTFTSASTVTGLCARLGETAAESLNRLALFCIGPVTAEAARERGLQVTAVADEHTVEGLVRAMAEYFEKAEGSCWPITDPFGKANEQKAESSGY